MKTLIKTNHENPVFRDVFNPFMEQFFQPSEMASNFYTPKANIVEHEKTFDIIVALPGINKDDIKIDLADQKLKISGKHAPLGIEGSSKMLSKELPNGSFSRVFKLGNQIDFASISAEFKDGLLHIALSKTAQASPKIITIK